MRAVCPECIKVSTKVRLNAHATTAHLDVDAPRTKVERCLVKSRLAGTNVREDIRPRIESRELDLVADDRVLPEKRHPHRLAVLRRCFTSRSRSFSNFRKRLRTAGPPRTLSIGSDCSKTASSSSRMNWSRPTSAIVWSFGRRQPQFLDLVPAGFCQKYCIGPTLNHSASAVPCRSPGARRVPCNRCVGALPGPR